MKRFLSILLVIISSISLTACERKTIQIFAPAAIDEAVPVDSSDIDLDTYYVKNGTKFYEVYKPLGTANGNAYSLNKRRVFYMLKDQPFVPVHYKGELVAYASQKANLSAVNLERFEDMGYSVGIFGGYLHEDGFLHINLKENIAKRSSAAKVFENALSSEVRIISIGGQSISSLVDPESGIITQLEKGGKYYIEYFTGTQYKQDAIEADTQFLKAFELYNYGPETISDTKNGYMCFNTPDDLKSGYYNINGEGLFLYHSYTRDEYVDVKEEDLNISYYLNEMDAIASYSQAYAVNVPVDTRDVVITASCKNGSDVSEDRLGKVISPSGTIYNMTGDEGSKTMSLSISLAKAGTWMVYIPLKCNVISVEASDGIIAEETTCDESIFVVDKDREKQRFMCEFIGGTDVFGYVVMQDNSSYVMQLGSYSVDNEKHNYLYCNVPYLKEGIYTVKIYYYKSKTSLNEVVLNSYTEEDSDIIIIE